MRAYQRHIMEAYVFLTPMIIGIVIFFVFPLVQSLRLSFGDLVKMTGMEIQWAGVENFTRAFFVDVDFLPRFLSVVSQALINLPLTIVFSLVIAILINKKIKFRGFFRTVFFLPFLIGNGYVMKQLMDQGVNGQVLQSSGVIAISDTLSLLMGPLVSDTISMFLSTLVVLLWNMGVQILLFLSGLQGISASIYEAARVDSANEWDCFWHITLPLISPVILLNVIYTMVDQFTSSQNALLITIMNLMFDSHDFEYAAAIGWIYFAFILLVILLIFGVTRRFIYTTEISGRRRKHAGRS